jgi:RND family efflux transporter MFP subunit
MKKKGLLGLVGALVLIGVILYMSGFFTPGKIKPGQAVIDIRPKFNPSQTAKAIVRDITEIYDAVGTIRPRTETKVEAQVTGKVRKVRVKAGDAVTRGTTLIILDDRQFTTRLERAQQGLKSAKAAREEARQVVAAAEAAYTKADLQYKRIDRLFKDNVVASSELEQARADFLLARAKMNQAEEGLEGAVAGVRQAQKFVEEARITQNYTIIKATEDGEVVKRLIEPGDLAVPGKPLLILQTAGSLRLEAYVREGLISRVRPGIELPVSIDSLEKRVKGVVEEVIPSADPMTRTFLVKVGLPKVIGAYPGMFCRLLVPSGTRRAVLIPPAALRRVGQLETVMVKEGQTWKALYVRTGQSHNGLIEVLSGLQGDETVALFGDSNG